jgi:PD-(D/E)XK nuclease superfamily
VTEATNSSSDKDHLERFVLDNPDLERLEAILGDFNPFVALRWTWQEVRHSQFLRWLLDPQETHGIGEYFLRAFTKRLAAKAIGRSSAPSVVDLDSWHLSGTEVFTEWNNIDVLARNEEVRFLVVIETKLDSVEHGQQLHRYRRLVESQYPDYSRLFTLLTVEGDAPSDDAYVTLTYSEVASLLSDMLDRRADQLGPEVRSFMSHYVQMLRRHIVEDSEVQELCRRIYQTHRRALDVIFEYRPDRTLAVSEFMQELVRGRDGLVLDQSTKAYVRFWPTALDRVPKTGTGWTRSGRVLLFEIDLTGADVRFKVLLGPGPQELRNRLHQWIKTHPAPFNRATTRLYPQWWSFHSELWLNNSRFEALDLEELKNQIGDRFRKFLENELPAMQQALEECPELSLRSQGAT